jgi:hypothetical protein
VSLAGDIRLRSKDPSNNIPRKLLILHAITSGCRRDAFGIEHALTLGTATERLVRREVRGKSQPATQVSVLRSGL